MAQSGIKGAKCPGESPIDHPARNSLISAQIESGKERFLPVVKHSVMPSNEGFQ